jgi:hypothetical protein
MQWMVFFVLITLMKGAGSWAMMRQIVLVSDTYLRSGVLVRQKKREIRCSVWIQLISIIV